MNLIECEIQNSNIFAHLMQFTEIYYDGFLEDKVRQYRAVSNDVAYQVVTLNIIRRDEDIIWKAFEDMLKRSVDDAKHLVKGVYVFDVLTHNIHSEINTYYPSEVTVLLQNHARKCTPGDKRLIKYSSVYGILHKINESDWGKLVFKTAVEVFKGKDSSIDLILKKLIKHSDFESDHVILLLND
ncbi:MAG: hypothetical protein ACI9E5_000407, partial [Candidatus Omnitrophota bacterium]